MILLPFPARPDACSLVWDPPGTRAECLTNTNRYLCCTAQKVKGNFALQYRLYYRGLAGGLRINALAIALP
jgi:hypothetical protein